MKKSIIIIFSLISLISVKAPVLAQNGNNIWEKEIRAFEQKDSLNMPNPGGILFVGSSSIRGWRSLPQNYPDKNVINRGFGGSEIKDAIHYFDRIIAKYEPRQIVLYAGDNDIASGKSPEIVFGAFKEFAKLVEERLPKSELIFLSIKPSTARWDMYDKMQQVNKKVEHYSNKHRNVTFVDVSSAMLNEKGKPNEGLLLGDGLHMTQEGYELWADIVEPYLID